MEELTKAYKEISLELITRLENGELDIIEKLLDNRQEILNQEILNEESNKKRFKDILVKQGILEIDNNISNLLNENIIKVKNEIREHKMSKQANNSYINFNKNKLNIFNEKV